ncbi:MAG: selenium cofactor biosynthesis protein YqeC [Eubacteriales bacterium]
MSNLYKINENNTLSPLPVESFLLATGEEKNIITLVGAGGKTTLLYLMAHKFSQQQKVFVSTTTHIYRPENQHYAKTETEMKNLWQQGRYAVMGEETGKKLRSLPHNQLKSMMNLANITLLEGDGAKCMPMKVPSDHEPVLLPESNIVIALLGLNALGKPLKEVCFRKEQGKIHLNKSEDDIIFLEDFFQIFVSPWGSFKNVGERKIFFILSQYNPQHQGEQFLSRVNALQKKHNISVILFEKEGK